LSTSADGLLNGLKVLQVLWLHDERRFLQLLVSSINQCSRTRYVPGM